MSESWENRLWSLLLLCSFIVSPSLLVFNGCTMPVASYHSTASITHSTDDTITKMKFVRVDKSLVKESKFTSSNKQYGVMTALDVKGDGSQKLYVLFAPAKGNRTVENFNDMNFSMSAPLTLDQAKALSVKLQVLVENWGKEMETDRGLFHEFSITPEHEIKQVSENVISRGYVFRFSFGQFMPVGFFFKVQSEALLQLGRNQLVATVKLDTKSKLYELKLLIDTAIKNIENQAG